MQKSAVCYHLAHKFQEYYDKFVCYVCDLHDIVLKMDCYRKLCLSTRLVHKSNTFSPSILEGLCLGLNGT